MSDFETLLERLLLDPAFKAALAADSERALVGYTLTDEERDLLMSELSSDAGRSSRMEERTSKAALFGLLGAVADMFTAPSGVTAPSGGPITGDSGPHGAPSGERPWHSDFKMDTFDVDHYERKAGGIQAADFQTSSVDEHKFFDELLTELGMPESDAASKDPVELKLPPDPVDFKLAPDPVDLKLTPDPVEYKLAPDVADFKLAPDAGELKVAPELAPQPGEIKPAPELAPPNPLGIKMAPDGEFTSPTIDLPAEPDLPHT